MKIKNLGILIVSLSLMCSCITVKKINESAPRYVPKQDFSIEDLNGSFANRPITLNQNGGEPLGKFFFAPFKVYEWGESIDLEGLVKFKSLSSSRLQVQLWKADSLCCEVELQGKVNDDYFEVRRKLKVIGVPFIYFTSRERKIILSLSKGGNLILKQGRSDFGNIFLFSGGGDSFTSYEFNKIN